jgi:hypothetical protein
MIARDPGPVVIGNLRAQRQDVDNDNVNPSLVLLDFPRHD